MSKDQNQKSNILKRYWKAYGGFGAIFSSYYFYSAILITGLLYPAWTQSGWWETVLSVMPNLLGFTLGGFAMWVAIGDENFKATISGSKSSDEPSPFMVVNATFAHFIFLQIFSILLALVNKAYNIQLPNGHFLIEFWGEHLKLATTAFYGLGYFTFIYALLSSLASVVALFSVSSWYDDYQGDGTAAKFAAMLKQEEKNEQMRERIRVLKEQERQLDQELDS